MNKMFSVGALCFFANLGISTTTVQSVTLHGRTDYKMLVEHDPVEEALDSASKLNPEDVEATYLSKRIQKRRKNHRRTRMGQAAAAVALGGTVVATVATAGAALPVPMILSYYLGAGRRFSKKSKHNFSIELCGVQGEERPELLEGLIATYVRHGVNKARSPFSLGKYVTEKRRVRHLKKLNLVKGANAANIREAIKTVLRSEYSENQTVLQYLETGFKNVTNRSVQYPVLDFLMKKISDGEGSDGEGSDAILMEKKDFDE